MAGRKRKAKHAATRKERRRKMKYIKDESPFMAVTDTAFQIREQSEGESHDGTLAEVINLCVDNHVPQQGQTLSVGDWKSLNRVEGILKDGPDEDGFFAIEDADMTVLKKVLGWTAAIMLRRNSPHLMEIVDSAIDKKPGGDEGEEKSDVDTVVESIEKVRQGRGKKAKSEREI